jgi:hypothetical protein
MMLTNLAARRGNVSRSGCDLRAPHLRAPRPHSARLSPQPTNY